VKVKRVKVKLPSQGRPRGETFNSLEEGRIWAASDGQGNLDLVVNWEKRICQVPVQAEMTGG
jgi:hypothetical protein